MTSSTDGSPYREAEARFRNDTDGLFLYLRDHRLEDPSLCLGYWLMRADRELGMNQSDVAARTAVYRGATVVIKPLTRGFLSAVLSNRTRATPDTYTRIARAVGANPIEFFLSEGWIDPADVTVYSLPHASDWSPIAQKLDMVPVSERPKVVALVSSIIDAVLMGRSDVAIPVKTG